MTQKASATKLRTFRTFLLMQQFAAREIGERIGLARKEASGMTQEQLAELLNVSKRSVQDYEAGVTIPWRHFQRLEVIFKRPMEWFLHGETNGEAGDVAALLTRAVGLLEEAAARSSRIEALLKELLESGEEPPPGRRGAG